jgi:hypothetical protein
MVWQLSGWQRLGLVLSLAWVVGFVGVNRVWVTRKAAATYSYALQTCRDHQDVAERLGCSQAADAVFNSDIKPRWAQLVLAAAWPVPLFWMLGWLAIWAGRWVRQGFEQDRIRRP